MIFLSLCSFLPVYLIADWSWDTLGDMILITSITLLAFEGAAHLFAGLGHPVLGLLAFTCVWFTCLLMNGAADGARGPQPAPPRAWLRRCRRR